MLAIALGSGPATIAAARGDVSYSGQVQPIFDQNCVMCHAKGAASGDLDLTKRRSYKALVAIKSSEASLERVVPGDPAKSYLIQKLKGAQLQVGGGGDQMPKSDIPRSLDPADLALITQWIGSGARNN